MLALIRFQILALFLGALLFQFACGVRGVPSDPKSPTEIGVGKHPLVGPKGKNE